MFFICYSLYLHVSLCPCLSVIFLALRLSLTPSQSSWVSICPSYSLFLFHFFSFLYSFNPSIHIILYLSPIYTSITIFVLISLFIHPSTQYFPYLHMFSWICYVLSIFLSFSPWLCLSLFLSVSLHSPTSFSPFKVTAYPGIFGVTFSSILSKVKKYVPMCQSYMPRKDSKTFMYGSTKGHPCCYLMKDKVLKENYAWVSCISTSHVYYEWGTKCPLFWIVFSNISVHWTALEDKDSVFLWSGGQVCLHPGKVVIISLSGGKGRAPYSQG